LGILIAVPHEWVLHFISFHFISRLITNLRKLRKEKEEEEEEGDGRCMKRGWI
jgi:hypothetical protein